MYPDSDALDYQKYFQLQPYYDRLVSQWVVKYPLEKRIEILKRIPIMNLIKRTSRGSVRNSIAARSSVSTFPVKFTK